MPLLYRKITHSVTREPRVPRNWPTGHVRVSRVEAETGERVCVWIHGHKHYLRSDTALELRKMLESILWEV